MFAGVGVAYILAVCLAQALDKNQDLTAPLLELFTLGTIADLAPLVGVNRRWVRRGVGAIAAIANSRHSGPDSGGRVSRPEQAPESQSTLGFVSGPGSTPWAVSAIPRSSSTCLPPMTWGVALERAMQCEQINHTRQELCQAN